MTVNVIVRGPGWKVTTVVSSDCAVLSGLTFRDEVAMAAAVARRLRTAGANARSSRGVVIVEAPAEATT